MNKILADAFRAKCQELMPEQQVQPHRQSFVRPTPGQFSGSQQPPPLQIVHQPAALFSSRPSPNINPPILNSLSTRPPTVNPITPSSTPTTNRPPTQPPDHPHHQLSTQSPPLAHRRQPAGDSHGPLCCKSKNKHGNPKAAYSTCKKRCWGPRYTTHTEMRPPAPHTGSSDIRAPAPPFRSTLPDIYVFASQRGMPPPATSSVLPHTTRWHNNLTTPSDLGTEFGMLNLTDDIIPHSSAHDLVCLSDDE